MQKLRLTEVVSYLFVGLLGSKPFICSSVMFALGSISCRLYHEKTSIGVGLTSGGRWPDAMHMFWNLGSEKHSYYEKVLFAKT
jgi:hypothetical protein